MGSLGYLQSLCHWGVRGQPVLPDPRDQRALWDPEALRERQDCGRYDGVTSSSTHITFLGSPTVPRGPPMAELLCIVWHPSGADGPGLGPGPPPRKRPTSLSKGGRGVLPAQALGVVVVPMGAMDRSRSALTSIRILSSPHRARLRVTPLRSDESFRSSHAPPVPEQPATARIWRVA